MSKNVVLGVTGGIAAYKALDLVSKLRKKDINVDVIMTESATKFVTPLSFQSLSQNQVIVDMFLEPKSWEIQHISLADKADVLAIVPATANVIGKIANGIADDMLTTTAMATKAPVLIAPAMNVNMYENPIVQRNIQILKQYGYHIIEPIEGRLACGYVGKGKLNDIDLIFDYIEMLLEKKKDYLGKKVLVTAGPTVEYIDPVRFISNRSSGKMGYAIARAARNRGAEVILITGPTNIAPPVGVKVIRVKTAEEMFKEVMKYYPEVDIAIKAAAVADYKVEGTSKVKIKKTEDSFELKLIKNKDILQEMGKAKSKQILVGFAAETNDLIKNAKLKLEGKNLDMIIANDVTEENSGFDHDTNTVKIIKNDGQIIQLPNMLKEELANIILNYILELKVKR
ncbi:bifunctional phosphopantothenoylcysteine decarboxylase/phosphopantothenate--cysteine ligase CoaBC [Caloramator sp. Dgby_cultured_2]|uniref:bifunctional phosphopantothenoylcysteine decarboxylase/phosphopantothenate--cysteine ligase CoaBC n=1 Tax=Caloramator sp. Dgby_cultured_2 TaxID=3029174 RepID=UPI00237DAD51|nr:bifunctional phosphopantothenoylcysteine decarboxylase/phosphopantothenate--cysteine ligase CoaBC [Caloramator sp. Dgby_cultured_2]WDU84079.1 bifunctional phosphopantothenoylcysteine decarboxylase/phosphopantothenate--cysteine ligase CoaBC [Caloramator sp. Dgby_cultured_2]